MTKLLAVVQAALNTHLRPLFMYMSHLISHQKHKFNIKFILNPSPNPRPLLTHTLPKSC